MQFCNSETEKSSYTAQEKNSLFLNEGKREPHLKISSYINSTNANLLNKFLFT